MRPEPSVSHVFLARQIPSDDPNIDQNTVFFDVFEGKAIGWGVSYFKKRPKW
jgi:hypothetical protein